MYCQGDNRAEGSIHCYHDSLGNHFDIIDHVYNSIRFDSKVTFQYFHARNNDFQLADFHDFCDLYDIGQVCDFILHIYHLLREPVFEVFACFHLLNFICSANYYVIFHQVCCVFSSGLRVIFAGEMRLV